ncbi:hypothetical protein C9374_010654 [Naegleria lovaniensis]|uniref:Uncharacterized protein n=1 Tax=Naegleria lovaniensis TaxID=51637 RepID=A0AA88GFP9_NAELO|nr:uncharacterized protein C9374_010654 [Naegleria lovaniensis]KAG2374635.1 hypothetical protein C9374_010654 [Naegleria lovaniensis]
MPQNLSWRNKLSSSSNLLTHWAVCLEVGIPSELGAKRKIKGIAAVCKVNGYVQRRALETIVHDIETFASVVVRSCVLIVCEANHHRYLNKFLSCIDKEFSMYDLISFDLIERRRDIGFKIITSVDYNPATGSSDDTTSVPSFQLPHQDQISWDIVKAVLDISELMEQVSDYKSVDSQKEEKEIQISKRTRKHEHVPTASTSKLQRQSGTMKIDSFVLDKSDCSEWPEKAISILLTTTKKNGGMGLPNNVITGVELSVVDLENVADALINSKGDHEAKILSGCKLLHTVELFKVQQAIVRWVFTNLLEYR